jgi:hypothetical protein
MCSDKLKKFKYENGVKIKNNYVPDISRTKYQSNKNINSPPQSRETILLKGE